MLISFQGPARRECGVRRTVRPRISCSQLRSRQVQSSDNASWSELDEEDEVEVQLNGIELSWDQRRTPDQPWTEEHYDGAWNLYPSRTRAEPLDWDPVEFMLESSCLCRGSNELLVRLVRRETAPALVLQSVRIWIRYAK